MTPEDAILLPQELQAFLDRLVLVAPAAAAPQKLTELADQIASLPYAPGSVVLVSLADGQMLLETVFAVLLAGHVPALLSPSLPRSRVSAVAAGVGAAAVISARRSTDRADRFVHRLGAVEAHTLTAHELMQPGPGHIVLLTSGTSGTSTGCLHAVRSLSRNAAWHAASIGLNASDTYLVTLPLHYSFAFVAQALAAFRTGCRLIVDGPPFSVGRFVSTVAKHEVTVSSLTPVLVGDLLQSPAELPAPLHTLTAGGAALPAADVGRLLARHPRLELYLTYGLTEAGPRVSTLAAHGESPDRWSSAGRPLPGVELTTRPQPGTDGQEVLVTSDTVMLKRLGDGGARGALVAPRTIATGDIGTVDDDGYLHLSGRSGDFVVLAGDKVNLASVRAVACSLPGVLRARTSLVAGCATARLPEGALELALDLDEASAVSEDDVRQDLYRRLSRAERPGRIVLRRVPLGSIHK